MGATNETAKLLKTGTYRFLSLNDTTVSDRFSRLVIGRMTQRGLSTTDEKHWTLGELFDEFVGGRVNVYPEYQRGMVSDLRWARELVSVCVLTSAPIAPIYLHRVGDGYEVVDGAQRLAAYFMFLMGGFPMVGEDGAEHWFCGEDDRCHWTAVIGADGKDGVASFVDESPVHDSLVRFHDQTRGMLQRQGGEARVLPGDVQGRLRGRKQSIVVMPGTWDRELSILYVVYTGLKAWRQTKDECLVHLHDRASRQLKPLEASLAEALRASGLPFLSPTRQTYGVLARAFACLEGFGHVPMEHDERLYVQLMLDMATRYADSGPDPDSLAGLARGVAWLAANGASVARDVGGRRAVHPDHLCVLLYVASTREGFRTRSVSTLLGFLGGTKKRREELLEAAGVTNAEEVAADYQEIIGRRRFEAINLRDLCRLGARIVN